MVDFGSLVGTSGDVTVYDLEKLFATLDVKSTHTEPRLAQREAMQQITARNEERDLVLKISTGAGKTTVGLLYLLGYAKKFKEPVVYLCPTTQLVEQVLEEAGRLGILAVAYPAGETYPDASAMRGRAILVCTYEKMFNAKSTFNRSDVQLLPCALVLDDAHAGAENVRKQFTLRISGDAFTALKEVLAARCKAYHPTKWSDVEFADPLTTLEVPHWIWSDLASDIRLALHEFSEERDFLFVWPYLESILPLCRCVVSGSVAEIAPEILPTSLVRPFHQAKHRLFMSATLADDSLLTRELGVDASATTNPILPPSDKGLGERMILAPSLIDPDLDRGFVIRLCTELAKTYKVVVLTSSELLATDWVDAGAKFYVGDTFSEGVQKLRDSSSGVNFAVFAQRYDGVDLPDDACRILVIDGIPHGESLIDRADAQMVFTPGGVRNRTVFRIEQGMGRPVRSHADYAVVLLVGADITSYVGRNDVLSAMTADTKNQIELSIELAELVRRSNPENPELAVRHVVEQCLGRDAGWKDFYAKKVRDVARPIKTVDSARINFANEERASYVLAMNNNAMDAVQQLRAAINAAGISGEERGVVLQRLSRIAYQTDPGEALRIQQAARADCSSAAIPPDAPRKPSSPGAKTVAEKFCAWFGRFSTANAAVIEAKKIADSIDLDGKPRTVERAIRSLGEALGADSSMPEQEFSAGPDNLWFWGARCFVIEVKNENQNTLHKTDSGQLHDSLQWARENYPEWADRISPITVAKVQIADNDAHYPDDVRVLGVEGCRALGTALHQLCQKMAMQGPVFLTPANVLSEMTAFGLTPEQLLSRHTSRIQ